jgi:hypothetical protein
MSTNNNRLGKEVQPQWIGSSPPTSVSTVNALKLQRLMSNNVSDLTALSLRGMSVKKLENFTNMQNLRRLDLSSNQIKRLQGLSDIPNLGMLNVSNNEIEVYEELRYLTELRTLNIGGNSKIKNIETHIVKALSKLQALIANDCDFSRASFIQFLPCLNTLILSKNTLTTFPTTTNFMMQQLTKISLNGNLLTSLPDLRYTPNIQELRVNSNNITEITDSILIAKHLKLLDISSNKLTNWSDIEILSRLENLTNLCIHSNSFPFPPPDTFAHVQLREDLAADKIVIHGSVESHDNVKANKLTPEQEIQYRHHILCQFQKYVGAERKAKVQLIVLDMKRVKAKWSHISVIPSGNKISEDSTNRDNVQINGRDSVKSGGKKDKSSMKSDRSSSGINDMSASSKVSGYSVEDQDDVSDRKTKKKRKHDVDDSLPLQDKSGNTNSKSVNMMDVRDDESNNNKDYNKKKKKKHKSNSHENKDVDAMTTSNIDTYPSNSHKNMDIMTESLNMVKHHIGDHNEKDVVASSVSGVVSIKVVKKKDNSSKGIPSKASSRSTPDNQSEDTIALLSKVPVMLGTIGQGGSSAW